MPHRPGWDHDHCAFCHAEIAAMKAEHVDFTAGYVTADDGYTSICQPCFDDFKKPVPVSCPADHHRVVAAALTDF